jgi:predicted transcriptional regulator
MARSGSNSYDKAIRYAVRRTESKFFKEPKAVSHCIARLREAEQHIRELERKIDRLNSEIGRQDKVCTYPQCGRTWISLADDIPRNPEDFNV